MTTDNATSGADTSLLPALVEVAAEVASSSVSSMSTMLAGKLGALDKFVHDTVEILSLPAGNKGEKAAIEKDKGKALEMLANINADFEKQAAEGKSAAGASSGYIEYLRRRLAFEKKMNATTLIYEAELRRVATQLSDKADSLEFVSADSRKSSNEPDNRVILTGVAEKEPTRPVDQWGKPLDMTVLDEAKALTMEAGFTGVVPPGTPMQSRFRLVTASTEESSRHFTSLTRPKKPPLM